MILAIDFDNTIHDAKNPIKGRRMGAPIEGAKESLIHLKQKGHKIIIHTVWGNEKGRKTIEDFMNYYKIPFDSVTNEKPQADIYLDDKAIRFEGNWEETLKKLV